MSVSKDGCLIVCGWVGERDLHILTHSLTHSLAHSLTHSSSIMQSIDPEELFTTLDRVGKGSFGEVFKG